MKLKELINTLNYDNPITIVIINKEGLKEHYVYDPGLYWTHWPVYLMEGVRSFKGFPKKVLEHEVYEINTNCSGYYKTIIRIN